MWICRKCGGTDIVLDGVQGTVFGYMCNLDIFGNGKIEIDHMDVMDYKNYQCVDCGAEDSEVETIAKWEGWED